MFKRSLLICSLLFSGISGLAAPKVETASTSGYYLGAQIGTAMHYQTSDVSYTEHWSALFFSGTSQGTAHTMSSQNLAERIFFGYMFNKYIGLEAGFDHLGQQKVKSDTLSQAAKKQLTVSSSLSIVGQYDLSPQFFAFAKAGYADISRGLLDKSGDGVRAELGLGYHLSNHFMLTASYAHFFLSDHTFPSEIHTFVGYPEQNATPVGFASLGLSYQF